VPARRSFKGIGGGPRSPQTSGSVAPFRFLVAVALLGLAVATVHGVRLVEPLGAEQGALACFARWIPRGWLPYRDLFDGRPPLALYWWSASRALPGDLVRAAWWWEGVWLAGSLATAYGLASRLWGKWEGLAAAALTFAGLWSPLWGTFEARAQAEELLALPMLVSAWLAWKAVDREKLALPAGLLVGVCGLFALPATALALAWVVTWLACTSAGGAARRLAWMLAGLVGAWALAFAWFAAHGAASSFVECVLVYPRHEALLGHPWSAVLSDFAGHVLPSAAFLFVPAVLGILRLARKRVREGHWAGAWVVATLAAVLLQRPLAGHTYVLAVPALAVVGAYGVVDVVRVTRAAGARPIAFAGLAALGLLGALEVSIWCKAYAPDLELALGRVSRDEYLAQLQQGHEGTALADQEAAARWLREQSAPGDGVLVWSSSPAIQALADRRPVTRYAVHKVLVTDAPVSRAWPGLDRRREDFLEDLRRDPPAVVLVGQDDRTALEPNDSYGSMMRFRQLRALLQKDYDHGPTVAGLAVFQHITSK
jgi:hypothetical protein